MNLKIASKANWLLGFGLKFLEFLLWGVFAVSCLMAVSAGFGGSSYVNLTGKTVESIGIEYFEKMASPEIKVAEDAPAQAGFLGVTPVEEAGISVGDIDVGSAAEASGLQVGDRILSVNGYSVESREYLVDLIASFAAFDEVAVRISRDGEPQNLQVVLDEKPEGYVESPLGDAIASELKPFDGELRVKESAVSFKLGDSYKWHNVALLALSSTMLGLIAFAVSNVIGLLDRAHASLAFTWGSALHLSRAGWSSLAVAFLNFLFGVYVNRLVGSLQADGLAFEYGSRMISWPFVVFGLFMLVVASVFEKGIKLKEFDEVTI